MIRSKTFCKFFQIQSSFPLQSFLKKKRISASIWAINWLPFLFTLPIFCQIKKTDTRSVLWIIKIIFLKWVKIDIAFLRNAINIWQKFLHTSRSYGTKNHSINKSPHHRIIKLSHQNPHFHHTSFHLLVSSFNVMV